MTFDGRTIRSPRKNHPIFSKLVRSALSGGGVTGSDR
jgi:hypothetical protein